jgi:hypothetical protein
MGILMGFSMEIPARFSAVSVPPPDRKTIVSEGRIVRDGVRKAVEKIIWFALGDFSEGSSRVL